MEQTLYALNVARFLENLTGDPLLQYASQPFLPPGGAGGVKFVSTCAVMFYVTVEIEVSCFICDHLDSRI